MKTPQKTPQKTPLTTRSIVALVIALCVLVGLLLAVMWPSQSSQSRTVTLTPTVAVDGGAARPVANAGSDAHERRAPGTADPTNTQPAGEQLRPGAEPGRGETFHTKTRAGVAVSGVLFRSTAQQAPLLVFMGEFGQTAQDWRRVLRTLRQSRDYHFVVAAAPIARRERAGRVESAASVATLEAALTWAQQTLSGSVNAIAVIGGGIGATAAVLLAAERRDIVAVAAISATPTVGQFRVVEVLPRLKARQTYWVAAKADERAFGLLAAVRHLPLATVVTRPGSDRGVALLSNDQRARTSLAGWLFAVLPRAELRL